MLCAQSQLFSIPRNLMSGSLGPCLMGGDNIFTALESPVLRWTTSLPVAKRQGDIRRVQRLLLCVTSHYSSSHTVILCLARVIRSTRSYPIRPYLRRGPNRPHNTRAQRLPSTVQHPGMLIIYRRRPCTTMSGSVRGILGLRHQFHIPLPRHDPCPRTSCPRRIHNLKRHRSA